MNFTSTISWKNEDNTFNVKTYDRSHQITFGGGLAIPGSSAPEYNGKAELPNPEELFISSVSSCFMLTFLYLAGLKGLVLEEYKAEAKGSLGKNEQGKMAVTEITISPVVTLKDNTQVDAAVLEDLYKKAHDNCFISSSVKTKVTIQ